MIKKTIIAMLLLSIFVFAKAINLDSIQGDYNNGKITFIISANAEDTGEFPRKHNKDWIALYKKGDSSAWKNVLTWGWAKDFGSERDGDAILTKNIDLNNGVYEVRYFKNNSYLTYKHSSFTVGNNEEESEEIQLLESNIFGQSGISESSIEHKESKHYRVSVKKGQEVRVTLFDLSADADIRVKFGEKASRKTQTFDCRSTNEGIDIDECFVTPKKDGTLYIEVYGYEAANYSLSVFDNYKLTLEKIDVSYKNSNLRIRVYIPANDVMNIGSKDWVALYKKGDSNAITRLRVLGNLRAVENMGHDELIITKNINLENGEYEVRYFKNNSSTTYKKSETFTVGN